MPGILFANTAMLLGLAVLSVPVLIHLLLRRKKKRLRFSSVRFFARQDEQSSQRRKLRNWLLLALRLLICAFLVFAFARPLLSRGGAASPQRKQQALIVLDRSLSMQANGQDGPRWARAREAARQIAAKLRPDDRVALVSCGQTPEILSGWTIPSVIGKLLNDLEPTWENGRMSEALQHASKLLSTADQKALTTLYIISDLQRSALANLGSAPLPKECEVKIVPVGDLLTPNLAISDLLIEGQASRALVASFSDEDSGLLKTELLVDERTVAGPSFSLRAGAVTNVEFTLPALAPGWHQVGLRLEGRDALAADNTRYEAVFVPEPIRVLVAETRSGTRSFEAESFFITAALAPGQESTNVAASGFTCRTISPDELSTALGAKGAQAWQVAVVPGLREVPSALSHALASYLERGGGVLLFLGDAVSPNRYNAEFRSLLPARLDSLQSPPGLEATWRIGEYNTNSPLFAPFQPAESGDLSLGRFTKRFTFGEGKSGGVVARFNDGVPLILMTNVGPGRLVLVNTSADASWTDWPKHKTFLPWLHSAASYLAGRSASAVAPGTMRAVTGGRTDVELGPGAAQQQYQLGIPNGKPVLLRADERGQLRDVTFPRPGVYSLRDGAGREVRKWGVNVPPEESDLSALSAAAMQQQLVRLPDTRKETLSAGLLGSGSNQRELWRVLLVVVLALLLIEMLLANRTTA